MFNVTRVSDQRLDLDCSGKLEKHDMAQLLDEMIKTSDGISNGAMVVRIGEFDFPSLGAIGLELRRLPELLKFIRRFDRVAVVVAKSWMRKASELEGALIPGTTVKAFDVNQEGQAEAWLKAETRQ